MPAAFRIGCKGPISLCFRWLRSHPFQAESIQNFAKKQFEQSKTRVEFVKRMEQLRKQAKVVQEKLVVGVSRVRTIEMVAKAEALYLEFEEAADPYVSSPTLPFRILCSFAAL